MAVLAMILGLRRMEQDFQIEASLAYRKTTFTEQWYLISKSRDRDGDGDGQEEGNGPGEEEGEREMWEKME